MLQIERSKERETEGKVTSRNTEEEGQSNICFKHTCKSEVFLILNWIIQKRGGIFSPIHFWRQRERGEGGKKGYRMRINNIQAFDNSLTNSKLI